MVLRGCTHDQNWLGTQTWEFPLVLQEAKWEPFGNLQSRRYLTGGDVDRAHSAGCWSSMCRTNRTTTGSLLPAPILFHHHQKEPGLSSAFHLEQYEITIHRKSRASRQHHPQQLPASLTTLSISPRMHKLWRRSTAFETAVSNDD